MLSRIWAAILGFSFLSLFHIPNKVAQEVPIGGAKAIDTIAADGNNRIAFEIETEKSNVLANIQKCRDAGIDRIVIVATSVKRKRDIDVRISGDEGLQVLSGIEVLERVSY